MPDDLVNVYTAATLFEAKLLADRLEEASIEVFIDNTDSPLDGLTAGDQGNPVRVLPGQANAAREIVAEFQAEKSDGGFKEEE